MNVKVIVRAVLCLGLGLGAETARSNTIQVDFIFEDPAWNASASYDDETGRRWQSEFAFFYDEPFNAETMVYSIIDVSVSFDGIEWDVSDFSPTSLGYHPPNSSLVYGNFGLVVDSFDRAALFSSACDTETGVCFGTSVFGFDPITGTDLSLLNGEDYGLNAPTGSYVARIRVPEPATLALLGVGLVGMGFAQRKRA